VGCGVGGVWFCGGIADNCVVVGGVDAGFIGAVSISAGLLAGFVVDFGVRTGVTGKFVDLLPVAGVFREVSWELVMGQKNPRPQQVIKKTIAVKEAKTDFFT
jgi:hypothetical protein